MTDGYNRFTVVLVSPLSPHTAHELEVFWRHRFLTLFWTIVQPNCACTPPCWLVSKTWTWQRSRFETRTVYSAAAWRHVCTTFTRLLFLQAEFVQNNALQ